jgi:radical SAM superfamily enzyme YgiQ (UPF0313 family)
VRVLLVSTYDLGRQPFGLASPAAWLRGAGVDVHCADVSRETLSAETVRSADAVAFYLPMHTATRLALPLIARVRGLNPSARVFAYGLYAPLNASLLRANGVEEIFGGEFEEALVRAITGPPAAESGVGAIGSASQNRTGVTSVPRLSFLVPDRDGLPPLTRYASLQMPDGARRVVGYTEASRGCKHLCRHCPIVPVYGGRFRTVPIDVVLADVRAQIERGAQHITFGDPDFFNGIKHARQLVTAFAREFPGITYDVTIKIEHLLRHAPELPVLVDTGCALVTSAVESIDDEVLAKLAKGHTRADFERAVRLCREAGLALSPTFIPFTPWTTVEGYCELLDGLASLELRDHVAPIQLAIRLLIPLESRVLELADVRALVEPFDERRLMFPWRHPDPRVDALQSTVERLVGSRLNVPRRELFERIWSVAHEAAGLSKPYRHAPAPSAAAIPFLTEPWYC